MQIQTQLPGVFMSFFLIITGGLCKAQKVLVPGENVFDKKFIKSGIYEMACYANANGQTVEISTFTIEINTSAKALGVYTTLQMTGSKMVSVDTSIADWNTFKPVYRSSSASHRDMVVHFGKEVTGYYYDKKTGKKHAIKEPASSSFDSYAYPYMLGLLPLATGYRNDLAVYEFKPGNASNTKKARIEEVKSNLYVSNLTGEHKVWEVSVLDVATNDRYVYHIDKESRRIWKVDITTQGQQMQLIDKEIDYNPFTTTFNKAETLKMIKDGNSVIIGQAFVRDNQNEGLFKKIAIANINKRQYARSGTQVVLIPYTDFFKEWMKLNNVSRKKGRSIPLPPEAGECIKVTTVYDNNGHFEFTNLMPGEYLLFTEFGYVHTSSRTEVTGYTDRYINGLYQGTSTNTTTYNVSGNAAAAIQKTVTIKSNGEKVEMKLKRTW